MTSSLLQILAGGHAVGPGFATLDCSMVTIVRNRASMQGMEDVPKCSPERDQKTGGVFILRPNWRRWAKLSTGLNELVVKSTLIKRKPRGELSARCDSESANVPGTNMVHEIVTGKRTVRDARRIAVESTVACNLGRKAPYAGEMLFQIPNGGTEDMDKSEMSGPIFHQAAGKLKDIATGDGEEATDRRPSRAMRPAVETMSI